MVTYMNKKTAALGILALASTLSAGSAIADTSTTTAPTKPPSVLDKLVMSYWAVYNGPSISDPSAFTNDGDHRGAVGPNGDVGTGGGSALQNLDSTLTLGYKITTKLVLAANYRFVLRPGMLGGAIEGAGTPYVYRNRDPWINLTAPKLVHLNGFNVSADIRFIIPATSGVNEYGAIRMTQTTTYDVAKTRLTLGVFTFERTNFLTDKGASGEMENLSLNVSPFANYQLTPTLAATFWTDVVQATYSAGGGVWDNAPADLIVGLGWDITPKLNFNPIVTVYPGYMSLNNTTLGAYISAKFL
jgi:hypothetical protein